MTLDARVPGPSPVRNEPALGAPADLSAAAGAYGTRRAAGAPRPTPHSSHTSSASSSVTPGPKTDRISWTARERASVLPTQVSAGRHSQEPEATETHCEAHSGQNWVNGSSGTPRQVHSAEQFEHSIESLKNVAVMVRTYVRIRPGASIAPEMHRELRINRPHREGIGSPPWPGMN